MTDQPAKDDVISRIDRERDAWRSLAGDVGPDRMEEPGPMGDWSFKDLAVHLLAWRERTIARLEAAGGGPPAADTFWPADVPDDDESVNAWIRETHRDRPLAAVLRDVDESYARLRAAIERLPEDVVATPGRLPWLGAESLAETYHSSHFRDEHEASVRAWLATKSR